MARITVNYVFLVPEYVELLNRTADLKLYFFSENCLLGTDMETQETFLCLTVVPPRKSCVRALKIQIPHASVVCIVEKSADKHPGFEISPKNIGKDVLEHPAQSKAQRLSLPMSVS